MKASHTVHVPVGDFVAVLGVDQLLNRCLTGTLTITSCNCDGEHCSDARGCGRDYDVTFTDEPVVGVNANGYLAFSEGPVPGYTDDWDRLSILADEVYGLDVEVTEAEDVTIAAALKAARF